MIDEIRTRINLSLIRKTPIRQLFFVDIFLVKEINVVQIVSAFASSALTNYLWQKFVSSLSFLPHCDV